MRGTRLIAVMALGIPILLSAAAVPASSVAPAPAVPAVHFPATQTISEKAGRHSSATASPQPVPTATVSGPIRVVEGSYPWFASEIDLASLGYVEEEFFVEGIARTYDGSKATGESPYKTRIVVRRPVSAKDFSGIVAVEWPNVTSGYEKDNNWFHSHEFFMRNDWAWVGVSAQKRGVDDLRVWNADRYGSLHVSDEQMYDIYAQAAKALRIRMGSDPMGGLRPTMLIGHGYSQGGQRVNEYYNFHQKRDGFLFDGFLLGGEQFEFDDDLPTKVIRVVAETDKSPIWVHYPPNAPNSDTFRMWQVAGASHATYTKQRQIDTLLQREGRYNGTLLEEPTCVKPAYSKIPLEHVMNAAFAHLVRWARGGDAPPVAPPLEYTSDGLALKRDDHGFAVGGIRLPELAIPIALQTGENWGSRDCLVAGSREPLPHDELMARYPDRASYVRKIDRAIDQSLRQGFMLLEDAQRLCLQARRIQLGWAVQQPGMSDRECRHTAPR